MIRRQAYHLINRTVFLLSVTVLFATPRYCVAQTPATARFVLWVVADSLAVRGKVGPDSVGHPNLDRTNSYAPGTRIAYSFALGSHYRDLQVTVDGNKRPPTGELLMDTDHILIVQATRVPVIDRRNRAMFALYRQLVQGAEVHKIYVALQAEFVCAADWYGGTRAQLLMRDAMEVAAPTLAEAEVLERADAKAGGAYEVPECARPRPADATTPRKKPG